MSSMARDNDEVKSRKYRWQQFSDDEVVNILNRLVAKYPQYSPTVNELTRHDAIRLIEMIERQMQEGTS